MLCVVHIEEIRERGLDLQRALPVEFLTAAVAKSIITFEVQGPGVFKGHFEQSSGRVLLKGHLTLAVTGPCKRCLTTVEAPLDFDFDLNFVKDKADGRPSKDDDDEAAPDPDPRASFQLEDVDTEPFDGQRIVLDPLIEEQIVLGLPLDLLCKPDCLGLCTVCGQDRNLTKCDHDQHPPDPRWAALKSVKLPN